MNKNKLIGLTLDRLFSQTLLRNPEEYLLYKDHRITYKNFRNESALISNAINNLGLSGKTIGVLDWNTIEFSELLYGIPLGHSIIHPVNIRLPPDQMIRTVQSAKDEALFFLRTLHHLWKK
ncbi:MAG: AMP-binding protein [Thermoplasmata archaeon]